MNGTDCLQGRQPASSRFAPVAARTRLELCSVPEPSEVRVHHVAGLLAWSPHVQRSGTHMVLRFEHGPTAMWLTQVLASPDAELVAVGGDGGTVYVRNPQTVLGRYGYRDGRWMLGRGCDAALGISRGAVHAAGVFDRRGLRVVCPTAAMMLTLTAVLARLGIRAKPTGGQPRAAVTAAYIPDTLARLGIGAAAAGLYQRLREVNGRVAQS